MNVIILETSPTSVDLKSETELQLRRKTASKDSTHREDQQWTVSQTTKHRPTDSQSATQTETKTNWQTLTKTGTLID